MKAILAAALVLALCGPAGARDTKADPVGTWKCEYNGVGKGEFTLVIKKDGDKLTGTMTNQDKQESKLKDLKFEDGELTFSTERRLIDNKVTIEYKLKIEGDTLKGNGAVDAAGVALEFDVEGKREK
jgi:hypothetical protein